MVMDQKVEHYKLPFYKRLTSIFVDFMFVLILFTVFLFPVSKIIEKQINNDERIMENINAMNDILLESGLFIMSDGFKENISDEGITLGYEYLNRIDEYLSIKSESELFKYQNGQYVPIGEEEELNEFYKNNWKIVYTELIKTEEYSKYNNEYVEVMDGYTSNTYAISLVVALSIIFLIIPLFNKNGKTLSKLIFKISVVNENYDKPTKLQIFIRQFFFVLLTFLFIPIVISLVMVLFEKRGKSLHDYISMTRLIDSGAEKMLIEEKKNNKKREEEVKIDEFNFKEGNR